jgi:hypothetical protein
MMSLIMTTVVIAAVSRVTMSMAGTPMSGGAWEESRASGFGDEVMAASRDWIAAREVGVPAMDELMGAIRATVDAQTTGVFGGYRHLMTTRGGTLGARAAAFADHQRQYAFASVPAAEWDGLGDASARAARIFGDLDRRRAAWDVASLDVGAVRFGTEAAVGFEDRANAVVGQGTIFEFERLASLRAAAAEGRARVFWVRVQVRFAERAADASALDVRVDFVYDEVGGTWIPSSIMTIGTGSAGRPVLMM